MLSLGLAPLTTSVQVTAPLPMVLGVVGHCAVGGVSGDYLLDTDGSALTDEDGTPIED